MGRGGIKCETTLYNIISPFFIYEYSAIHIFVWNDFKKAAEKKSKK
jgi:hypothetical protein